MEITIRRAEAKDAERLVELLHIIAELHHNGRPDFYVGGSKYTVKDMNKKIKNKDELILVAVDENDYVIGYTMSKIKERKAEGAMAAMKSLYIDDVCVDANYRRCGAGRMLMDETVKFAEKEKCHNVELNVWAFNKDAIKFYEKCGMKKQRQYMEIVLD